MILVVAEHRDGKLNRATWEAVAAGQALAAGQAQSSLSILVLGANVGAVAAELSSAEAQAVVTIDTAALEPYTADGFTAALAQAVAELKPTTVILPHTYQTRDFAPKLASRLERALVTDVTALKTSGGVTAFVRPMFQGKLTADVVPQGDTPHFITVQVGSFRADGAARGAAPAPVRPRVLARKSRLRSRYRADFPRLSFRQDVR